MEAKIKQIVEKVLNGLMIEIDSLEVIRNPDPGFENNFDIKIKTPDSPLLIGNHGRTLEDLKTILRLIINNNFEEKIWINIEINDYIEKKFDKLLAFIARKIDFVKKSGKEVVLPYYNGYERKKIHSYVAENEKDFIETKSVGEGKDRRMHLFLKEGVEIVPKKEEQPKKISISIDLDGVGI